MNAKESPTLERESSARKATPRVVAPRKQSAQPVLFEYHDRGAHKVCIAGNFNDWKADGLEMVDLGNGKWAKNLLLPPGTYEYRLVVDGKWICDPSALKTVPNPFGELNSLLQVEDNPDTTSSSWSSRKRESTPRNRSLHSEARS
jgi:hypothetical protein